MSLRRRKRDDAEVIERRFGETVYYQFERLAGYPALAHGISGRAGNKTQFPQGLNLSFLASDDPQQVVAARREVCAALGLQLDDLVVPRQIHGQRVAVVGRADRGKGAFERETALADTDALTTAEDGVALFVSAADCVPLLIYDPVSRAIAAAHAGWRGTVAKIATETVNKMIKCYGSRPVDLVVGIGPSIGPCCYAVGEEVVRDVDAAFGGASDLVLDRPAGQPHFDLWRANLAALVEAGVDAERVEIAGLCTACRKDLFFSHRAEHRRAGRFGAFIALNADSTRDDHG